MIDINKKFFFTLLFISTLIKIIFSYYFGDDLIEKEWGIINYNLINFGEFSYYLINGERIPTIYMPPLYSYFLYLFSFLELSEFVTVKIILFIQCVISSISIMIFFSLLKIYFSDRNAYLISILYLFYPLNFYSPSQISSVSLQVFLLIFFTYLVVVSKSYKSFLTLGIISGLLILIRGEFWLLFIILILLKIIQNKKNIFKILLCLTFVTIIITPKLISNYLKFDEIILTKSFGYNLWRGNSEEPNINGSNIDMTSNEIIDIFKSSDYDLNNFEIFLDDYFYNIANKNITNQPIIYIKHYFKKFIAFSVFNFNSTYPNYYNPAVFIPEIIISLFALFGILVNVILKKNYEILLIISYYLILIPVFFVLPRYKLFILPLYFIFASQFYFYLRSIFSKKQ